MKKCCSCHRELPKEHFYISQGKLYSRCKECDTTRKRKERKLRSHSQVDRKSWLKKQYDLSPEMYINLFDKQKGRCAICNIHQSELDYHLAVDHCHTTGTIRGLLCRRCNSALGLLDDSIEKLDKCKEYLNGNIQ